MLVSLISLIIVIAIFNYITKDTDFNSPKSKKRWGQGDDSPEQKKMWWED
ncbi:hypothetical protein [Treponema sp.]